VIGPIELTEEEQDLAVKIVFDLTAVQLKYEQAVDNGERAATLIKSLLSREAIPDSRQRYFADPSYNASNPKASRASLFLRNVGTWDGLYRHPHFLPYLKYFLYGADLPIALKESFQKKAQDDWVKPDQLVQHVRFLVRSFGLMSDFESHKLPDAFYQLALDCECEESAARQVRAAVMRIK
jgi:hypothetical protein